MDKTIVIFDLDNTLIDSDAKFKNDLYGAFQRLGKSLKEEDRKSHASWYELIKLYDISRDDFDREFEKRKTWEQSLEDGEVRLFPETIECLTVLGKKGASLNMISRSKPEFTNIKIKHFDLEKYFDNIMVANPKAQSKKDVAIEMIRKFSDVSMSYCVGDKLEDVVIAQDLSEIEKVRSEGILISRDGMFQKGAKKCYFINNLLIVPKIVSGEIMAYGKAY